MYTIYSCDKSNYEHIFRSWHGGVCPICGGKLHAECVSEAYYNKARS